MSPKTIVVLPVFVVAWSVPWRTIVTDIAVVLGWFGVVTLAFVSTGWPTELYYVVVIGGILGYTVATGAWSLPGDDGTP